jgi:hypothetical protein
VSQASTFLSGTVVETMASGGYTYLSIENSGVRRWAAIPQSDVRVGQQVELAPGMEMRNFTSKTLDRTFPSILFCQGKVSPHGSSPASTAAGRDRMPAAHGMSGIGKAGTEKMTAVAGKVTETMDAGTYTYVAVEKNGEQIWVAVPLTKVTVGEEVSFVPGTVMKKFTSKTLGRTFEALIFSGGIAAATSSPEKSVPSF